MSIFDSKCQPASTRPVFTSEVARQATRLTVDYEIDVTLAVQENVFGAVPGYQTKPHALKQGFKDLGLGRGELDELESA